MRREGSGKNYLQEFEERQKAAQKFVKEVLAPTYEKNPSGLNGVSMTDLIDPLVEEYRKHPDSGVFEVSDIPLAALSLKIDQKGAGTTLESIQRDTEQLIDEHARAELGRDYRDGLSYEARMNELRLELNELRNKKKTNQRKGLAELTQREERRKRAIPHGMSVSDYLKSLK